MLSKHSRTSLSIPGIDRYLRNEFCVIFLLDVVLPKDKPILRESIARKVNLYNKYNYINKRNKKEVIGNRCLALEKTPTDLVNLPHSVHGEVLDFINLLG